MSDEQELVSELGARPALEISASAFDVLRSSLAVWNPQRPNASGFKRMSTAQLAYYKLAYLEESVSSAIRTMLWNFQVLPALSLLRVRAEYAGVTSYLIHADESEGIIPYLAHYKARRARSVKIALSFPPGAESLRKLVPTLDNETALRLAKEVWAKFVPGYDAAVDDLPPKWTPLDLRSMLKKRDAIAVQLGLLFSRPLEAVYTGVYELLNSLVHLDAVAISEHFLLDRQSSSGDYRTLLPEPSWVLLSANYLAALDLISSAEMHYATGIPIPKALNFLWSMLNPAEIG